MMDIPVFRLEGILKNQNEISDFEGPLTLILYLLSKNKVEIRDISITMILDQYLEFLGSMTEKDLNAACEFVVMASHLAYIKTKMLLGGDEEISEIEQLISSLEQLQRSEAYSQIKVAAQTLSGLYGKGASMIESPPEYLPQEHLMYAHVSGDLSKAMLRLINREDAIAKSMNPKGSVYPEKVEYSIPEKTSEVLRLLKVNNQISLHALFSESRNRAELIATLIAILELCRVGSLLLLKEDEDITISYSTVPFSKGLDSVPNGSF